MRDPGAGMRDPVDFCMTREQVKEVLDRVLTWPPERQEDAVEILKGSSSRTLDFGRLYLLEYLLMSGFVERYGYVTGLHAATESAPRINLTGDPYYTDGLRLVVVLSNQTTTLTEAKRRAWESPPMSSQKD